MAHIFETIRLAQTADTMHYGHELSKAGNELKWQWADYTDLVYRNCMASEVEATKKDCAAWVSYTFTGGKPAPLTIYDYACTAAYYPPSIGGGVSLRDKYSHLPFEHFVAAKTIADATGFAPDHILGASSPLISANQLKRDFLETEEEPYVPAYQEPTPDYEPPPYEFRPTDKPYIVVEAESAARAIKRIQDMASKTNSGKVKFIAQTLYLMLDKLNELMEELEYESKETQNA